jgi:hypothetical protein
MEDVGIWYIWLWTFGLFYSHLVYFVVIWNIFRFSTYVVPRKIWQPSTCGRRSDVGWNFKYQK